MNSKLHQSTSSVWQAEEESLFSGVWIRWSTLNQAERLVCTIIVLMPLWWFLGLIPYLTDFITIAVVIYEWRRSGGLRLKPPNWLVFALFAYFAYNFLDSFFLFFNAHPLAGLPPDAPRKPIDLIQLAFSVFSLPYLVWYIQSHNVRVRLEVVVWACSISIIQSLAIWLVVHFVFKEPFYNPPRTVWAVLTGKNAQFSRFGAGNSNYLALYWPDDKAFAGVARFYSFFHHAENFGLFVGVVGTLALDIKNRLWSVLLFTACVFLIGLSGTRSVWLAFPIVLFVRSYFGTRKISGAWLPFALIATISFVTLSLPPVTERVFNTYTDTATFISDFRENSTESRGEIYAGTLEKIVDNPVNFLFGYKVISPEGFGTHSFLMGSLLYQGGLISTGLFIAFWALLIMWIYRTRRYRPACCLFILLFLSLTFVTMLFTPVAIMAVLLNMMLSRPAMKTLSRNAV